MRRISGQGHSSSAIFSYALRRLSISAIILCRFTGGVSRRGIEIFSQVLHENSVIPKEHLTTFQNMASFRNMLVRRYEKTDNDVVYSIFKKRLDDFDLFIRLVAEWIKSASK